MAKKYQLLVSEKIELFLILAFLISLVVALIQSIFAGNRLSLMWGLTLLFLAFIILVNGIAFSLVSRRFKRQALARFQYRRGFLIRSGLFAFGNHFRYYPVFRAEEDHLPERLEAVDPIPAREIDTRFEKERSYDVWVWEENPSLCCTDKNFMRRIGTVHILIGVAILALALWQIIAFF